jgi:hypothetical protein
VGFRPYTVNPAECLWQGHLADCKTVYRWFESIPWDGGFEYEIPSQGGSAQTPSSSA